MNRELEEQKIRQWFREARHGDESRAPSFVETLAAAQSKTRRGGWRLNVWRIAFVTVALIAIGVSAVVFFKQSVTQPQSAAWGIAHRSSETATLGDSRSLRRCSGNDCGWRQLTQWPREMRRSGITL